MDDYQKYSENDQTRELNSRRVLRLQTVEQSAQKNTVTETRSKHRDYLEEKQIFDTFRFLIGHLIVYRPTDPIQYLYQLLDDCILFGSGLKEPRLLWMERHVDCVFQSIDSNNSGFLSLDGYKSAMKILGVRSYNPCPDEHVPGYVDQRSFRTEALYSLKNELVWVANKFTRLVSPISLSRNE